jgi:hypothetical protein
MDVLASSAHPWEMPELRDNDPDDDALLRAAEKFPWTPADDEAAQKSETTDSKPKALRLELALSLSREGSEGIGPQGACSTWWP